MAAGGNDWFSASAGLSSELPRLVKETELQKMLTDEKMRSEQHKVNFMTLKAEFTRMQEKCVQVEEELVGTIQESKLVKEKYEGLLSEARRELADRHGQCEELKTQVINPKRVEMLKIQFADEVEKPYKEKYQQMSEELERYRSEYNKMNYDYSFLKSEYEHERNEHRTILEEIKLRHETEVSNLRKEREMIMTKHQSDTGQDSQKVRSLHRENAQLHLKLKGLLTELEEIRAQREHLGLQSDSVQRLQTKQFSEQTGTIKALETEKASLKLQNETLQRELANTADLQTELNSRVHDLEKDNLIYKNRAEEVTHKSKLEQTNIKMDMLKERGQLERERDKLKNELEEMATQLEILQHTLDQKSNSLVEKEREAVKRVQSAREDEWSKLHVIETEKLELETKLQEIERQKIDEETRRSLAQEKYEEKIQLANDAKESAEKELLVLKTRAENQKALLEQVEQERSSSSELKSRLHKVESQYNAYVSNEQQLLQTNRSLQDDMERMRRDLRRAQDEVKESEILINRSVAKHRATWEEEKQHLEQRVHELEGELGKLHSKFTQVVESQKKKKRQYSKLVSKLKQKMALYQAKLEEMKLEKEAYKNNVSSEQHTYLKKQLKDLLRRHKEYRGVLLSTDPKLAADISLYSASTPLDRSQNNSNWCFKESETIHHQELQLLKERLDLLDSNQRQQMAELKTVTLSPIKKSNDMAPEKEFHDSFEGAGDLQSEDLS